MTHGSAGGEGLSASSSSFLYKYDKRIRGRPHDQIGAVVRIADALRENPFPVFVNAVLIRLAEAFRDGSNQLRLVIVRVIRECTSEFSLVTSNDEIVRKVIKVSHSNDDNARALMLQFTSAISQAVSENKQLHHLLLESLDTESHTELVATIDAVEHLCVYSVDFSHLVIGKISDMLLESKHSPVVKTRLIRVLSNFHGDFKTVSKAFDLGQRLIGDTSDRYNLAALISAMTRLAVKSRLTVERQLMLLLTEMEHSNGNQHYLCLLLQNVKILAGLSQFWTIRHLNKFLEMFSKYQPSNTNRVNAEWIEALEILSYHCNIAILTQIKGSLLNWSYLMSVGSYEIQLVMIGLVERVLLRAPDRGEHFLPLLSTSFQSLFSSDTLNKAQHRKLFDLFDNYLRISHVKTEDIVNLSQQLIESRVAAKKFSFAIECLRKASNFHQALAPHIAPWITAQIQNPRLSAKSLCQLAELQFSCCSSDVDPNAWLNRNFDDDFWLIYKIARSALESGLWTQIALPMLKNVRKETQSYETSLWIETLQNIAESQITSTSLCQFGNSCEKLMNAELNLKVLDSIPARSKIFKFPLRFVNALRELVACSRDLLSVFTLNAVGKSAGEVDTFCERFRFKVAECLPRVVNCRETWVKIYAYMFDADKATQEYVDLLYFMCLIYERFIKIFSEEAILGEFSMITEIVEPSVRNQELYDVLFRARENLNKFGTIPPNSRTTLENIKAAVSILGTLTTSKICIPRYFFQQTCFTDIKLHVLPEPKDNQSSVVPTSKLFPVTVEGFIMSNNKSKIEKLTITAVALFERDKFNYEKQNTVTTQEGKYFKTQFLMDIHSSGKIIFRVDFMDKNSKHMWVSDCTAQMNISFG
ncbi:hypothetical protein L596_015091 [Steinernema carpocapsae]|uniref:Integrator complex subunit 7 n=1 Tax=Steinernema carpocapsae TaxID=34508 RepID=A0A4U5NE57_STECR|nr:hypothetical protein L596_015091 [Steinernema carpocapsae]